MAALMGIDIAWARPAVEQIKATGAQWVARYFSTDPSKNLTAAEVVAYKAAGLGIVTVWETTTGRARAGFAAGVADAQAAEVQRNAVGLPDSHVHHFAVDEDTTWAAVQPYFDGAASVIGLSRLGCYGGFAIVEGAYGYGIRFLWQTTAWSGGVWSRHATIQQTGGTTLSGDADLDFAQVPDFGQYPRPTPTPTPATKSPLEDDMAFEKDIKPGFGADANGVVLDETKCTVAAIPPQNGHYWGLVAVSFGSDFEDALLRVAVFGADGKWRIQRVKVPAQAGRINIDIQDGDQKVSVMRMMTSATDTLDSIPVSCLVEAFRK